MNIGLELTFLRKKPFNGKYGFTHGVGTEVAKKFNNLIKKLALSDYFYAKCEVYHLGNDSCLIEVKTYPPLRLYHFDPNYGELDTLYNIADQLDLTARIIKNTKDKKIYYPTGGGHIHIGTDFIRDRGALPENFLIYLNNWQTNMYTDYANRPYIKWLFAEWFDDLNSQVYDYEYIKKKADPVMVLTRERLCIRPRFSMIKNLLPLPTYEFRFFDAQRTSADVRLDVNFLEKWITYIPARKGTIKLKITQKYFKKLKNLRFAWGEISAFLTEIGLDPKAYRAKFDENYTLRMKYGEMR